MIEKDSANWFTRVVKRELQRRHLKVTEVNHSDFAFITENTKGKRAGVFCKPHGHITTPERRKLHSLCHKMGLDAIYTASEAYSEGDMHKVKVIELI